jgi:hypothetical protein
MREKQPGGRAREETMARADRIGEGGGSDMGSGE